MFFARRILCGIIGGFLIFWGAVITNDILKIWQIIGFCCFVGGVTLVYIALKQKLPSYSFWITLVAIGLAYALLINNQETSVLGSQEYNNIADNNVTSSVDEKTVKSAQVKLNRKKKAKKKSGFDLSAYPRLSGSISVIHAHVYYIDGRYVRLYGVDAPDNDQLCSDASGASYNCGEIAASWVRNWIDKHPIDCYVLKVEPRGRDLVTCVWGDYDIGAGLVGAGWGLADTRETDIYKPYEIKAQNESAGLWQGTFYTPDDWRDIKRRKNDFTITKHYSKDSGFFGFGSWFK